jgi:hypothetical protein
MEMYAVRENLEASNVIFAETYPMTGLEVFGTHGRVIRLEL